MSYVYMLRFLIDIIGFVVVSAMLLLMASTSHGQVLINEVLYDPPGTDKGCFVELIGEPGLSLDDYFLAGVNGGNGEQYNVISLSGNIIPPDGYFVVAQDESVPEAELIDKNADFQNSPDNIELWHGDDRIDSVGYGDFSNAVFTGEGDPTLDPPGYSIGRRPDGFDTNNNGMDFVGLALASPGSPNGPLLGLANSNRLAFVWGHIKFELSGSD